MNGNFNERAFASYISNFFSNNWNRKGLFLLSSRSKRPWPLEYEPTTDSRLKLCPFRQRFQRCNWSLQSKPLHQLSGLTNQFLRVPWKWRRLNNYSFFLKLLFKLLQLFISLDCWEYSQSCSDWWLLEMSIGNEYLQERIDVSWYLLIKLKPHAYCDDHTCRTNPLRSISETVNWSSAYGRRSDRKSK